MNSGVMKNVTLRSRRWSGNVRRGRLLITSSTSLAETIFSIKLAQGQPQRPTTWVASVVKIVNASNPGRSVCSGVVTSRIGTALALWRGIVLKHARPSTCWNWSRGADLRVLVLPWDIKRQTLICRAKRARTGNILNIPIGVGKKISECFVHPKTWKGTKDILFHKVKFYAKRL